MARENFASALSAVLKHEGGWADHPNDPGGATMKGVTLATYRRYRPGATKAQLRNITDAELQRIYRDGYWDVIRGDDLPSGIDYAVFDFAVNSGPGRAAKYLQGVLGVARDGVIGPKTIAAAHAADPIKVITDLCDRRMAFLHRLSTWPVFGRGWSSRVRGVRQLALSLTAEPKHAPIPADRLDRTDERKSPLAIIIAAAIAIIGAIVAKLTGVF